MLVAVLAVALSVRHSHRKRIWTILVDRTLDLGTSSARGDVGSCLVATHDDGLCQQAHSPTKSPRLQHAQAEVRYIHAGGDSGVCPLSLTSHSPHYFKMKTIAVAAAFAASVQAAVLWNGFFNSSFTSATFDQCERRSCFYKMFIRAEFCSRRELVKPD